MESIKFDELGLRSEIVRAVTEMGFEEASPIQAQAIPAALTGIDIIGQAQTGTGKTAAFGIPVLQKIDPSNKHIQAIVLCPTRELAIQVADEIRKLCRYTHGIKLLPVYGGQDIVKQIRSLKGGIQIVIGTPGRVMDHMRRHTIKTEHVHTVVLDEADEMLDMGFREDIETILEETPESRQTLLFSATMPKEIMAIAKKYQKNAKLVKVVKKELTVPNIDQYYYEVKRKNKEEVLSRLLDIYSPKLSLVFCNTKRQVDELVTALKNRGYFAEGIHGDLKQSQRDRVMNSFRKGNTDILVATDVAARGIDVDDVEAVFNYDLPQDDEYYVHRIGRTGRAGRTGKSFSFVSGKEIYKLKDIQRYCKTKILAQPIPSMDDVTEIKVEKILDQVSRIIEEEDLTSTIELISNRINEEDFTAMDIAAAFLKLAMGSLNNNESDEYTDFGDTGAEAGMVRLFINIGKKNARPKDILGAIAGESGMPGKLVGTIDMYDKYTFVEVPREYAKEVLAAMSRCKIKGKSINIEPANPNPR
ncbi:ATP-dependent RNA helicase DeaD [Acetitomaculum ruminis DSM 5522]|uniref:ATP-dependent RNA helicase CshA n=1 Tax=Acetitomaculum ruminis DSM 5522 TaxID=1120918 RepID=A0A1I0YFT9_9FIRM|nr:DEAD/DEAH box helicase [Acetitomaculum ruminis]SFB11043.1 ATP-dependent RNA helicase DeaD [Acetitomaculum ruminis DSM 5522]